MSYSFKPEMIFDHVFFIKNVTAIVMSNSRTGTYPHPVLF